ncbi:MAG: PmoA family protein [Chitinophagaceae bacterium]
MLQPNKNGVLAVFLLLLCSPMVAQRIATMEIKLPAGGNGLSIPVEVNLDAITFLPDSVLQLVEVTQNKRVQLPYQISTSSHRVLHWLIAPGKAGGRLFELVKGAPMLAPAVVQLQDAAGSITVTSRNNNLLRYNYATVYPPPGVDTVYKRSGFIHPLWSPRGQELTRTNAPDHYHHWGLWNPWTQVLFEKDTIDFWNLYKKQGTVRFAHLLSAVSGGVFAEYASLHEHVVFKKMGESKTALNEVQTVRVYQPEPNAAYYIADITIVLTAAGKSAVELLEYRYGGLGLRATAEWNKSNSVVLTSEGKARKEADGSTARWCMIQGSVKGDSAGLVMMSYPANYNHPEPLRVWPEDMNGRGDVFLNFSPTKNRNWTISPGKEYLLRYRFLVFNDRFTGKQADAAWQNFANPPVILIKKEPQK